MTMPPLPPDCFLKPWLQAVRPAQWIKNGVVLAAYVFALGDRQQVLAPALFLRVLAAALLFCLVSSGVYLLNDVWDREQDRAHPRKKNRPLAAGRIHPGAATAVGAGLLAVALAVGYWLSPPFFMAVCAYVLLQGAYTLMLKRVALLDVFMIAAGFVLRALAGALVAEVMISPWLLLCTFLLAMFLALCKRRHEKTHVENHDHSRHSMRGYDLGLLDQLVSITSATTVTAYAIYTLWPDTVAKFGTQRLALTIPFVIFGLFRYLDLVYRHAEGERPEIVLFTDRPLILNLLLYGASLALVWLCR